MKKQFRQTLSVIMSLIMIMSMFAGLDIISFAEDDILNYLTYEINDGEVTITGCDKSISGDVVIPDTIEGYPVTVIGENVFAYCDSLKSVIIPDSVISIEDCAFFYSYSLESVTIGSSVTTIGASAFFMCSSLTSISISKSVTSIGSAAFGESAYYNEQTNWENDVLYIDNYLIKAKKTISDNYEIKPGTITIADEAFDNCDNITSIIIPDSVTSIGDDAFYYCDSLTSITIPDGVTSIGEGAFRYCDSLIGITVDENNENYSSDEYGVLFNKDKTELIQYPISNTRTEYVIPNSVTIINDYAFADCTSLVNITIPDNVTTICDYAFADCTSLVNITIPDNVTIIGYSAFGYCTSLESVTIGNSVTTIGHSAFSCCDNLKSVTIGNSVTTIGDGAFEDCNSLTDIIIPDSVTIIKNGAFRSCSNVVNISIPDSAITICAGAFFNTDYYYDQANWENDVLYIGNHLIEAKESVSGDYEIKPGTITIAESAFFDCWKLNNIIIPDSVISIGSDSFNYCDSIKSVTIPSSVTSIGKHAFGYGFGGIKTEGFEIYGTPGTAAEVYANENDIPFISVVPEEPPVDNPPVEEPPVEEPPVEEPPVEEPPVEEPPVEEPPVEEPPVEEPPVEEPPVEEPPVEEPPVDVPSENDSLKYLRYEINDGEVTITACDESVSGKVIIPDTIEGYPVTVIGSCSFESCTNLISIIIPDSVITIDDGAFMLCESLTSVTIGNNVTTIGDSAFYYCLKITDVIIPDSVTTIDAFAFEDCVSMTKVTVPANVTTIGEFALGYCNQGDLVAGFEIHGTSGTAAEKYAKENGITFVAVESEDPPVEEPADDGKLDVKGEGGITTDFENKISQIGKEETAETLSEMINNENFAIVDKNGKVLTEKDLVGTGSKIQILDSDGSVVNEYTVLVPTDIDGNGKTTAADARLALRASAQLDTLEGVYATAADAVDDDKITASDARKILRISAGLE